MSDLLSQAEIDALLSGTAKDSFLDNNMDNDDLTPQEIDALGEIGNISIGTSATTLFTLLGHKVTITTPRVSVVTWDELSKQYPYPYVAVKVEYTNGLIGSNLLILKEEDTKLITDLMMGGEGKISEGELTELHLSAIGEVMNQMIGSSATSMSSMFKKRIEISPPKAFIMKFDSPQTYVNDIEISEKIVKVAFKMVVGDLMDSEIMQLIPIKFAKDMVESLLNVDMGQPGKDDSREEVSMPKTITNDVPPMQTAQTTSYQQQHGYDSQQNYMRGQDHFYTPNEYYSNDRPMHKESVNVQPAQFQAFDDDKITLEKKNINLIMDVPLQVTVELGRTQKLIKDILKFGPGSIIELDKLAGEPVDILVNGKAIAKGEVVVIDESFGVRITDIVDPSKRL
ncbi:MAG TPA: flagellar motor switch phosphatase FliY [Clostridiaceae bacterium]|nr:flagellar motor switch phosphatase FliY [Clostridiaceae bacterium]